MATQATPTTSPSTTPPVPSTTPTGTTPRNSPRPQTGVEEPGLREPASEQEFAQFRSMCERDEGWVLVGEKPECQSFISRAEGSPIIRVKLVSTSFSDVPAAVLYDVLLDPQYRAVWDENVMESFTVERIDTNNEIAYYSARLPTPMTNRDWVIKCATRREENGDYLIFNRSVFHSKCPEKKGLVRATSITTGYLVHPIDGGKSCTLTYVSHNEWNGWLPSYLVNMALKKLAPSVADKILEAARQYPCWKSSHDPDSKPWLQK